MAQIARGTKVCVDFVKEVMIASLARLFDKEGTLFSFFAVGVLPPDNRLRAPQ